MKKKRITYGVSGMMEYQCLIRFGKNTLKVTFTGGSMNAIGVTPATFTTSNFLIQQAIENSNEFKRGRIRVVSFIELDEDLRIERPVVAPAPVPVEKAEETDTDLSDKSDESEEAEEAEEAEAIPQADETPKIHETPQADETQKTEVEFSCNDDAKDYLEQTFGFVRSKLHNREEIIAAGASKGIQITFV